MGDVALPLMLAMVAAACAAYAIAPQWCRDSARALRARTVKALRRRRREEAAPATKPPEVAEKRIALTDGPSGWLAVASAADLLEAVHAERALERIHRETRLSQAVWERDLLPAIHRYAEFVQLFPASESHHHAHVGGLLTHTLEAVAAAVTYRNAYLLPQGAQAELVDAQRDHWTYVVFFAALLHDVGKPVADLRIDWTRQGEDQARPWLPIAGSLRDCGAQAYKVSFTPKSARDYGAHSRLAVILLQRLAPPCALAFLSTAPAALQALTRYLGQEEKAGAVADIVQRADRFSTSTALAQGSRARFPTATSVPLVELLMGAVRAMLQRGGLIPLNRDGAMGWIWDGSAWFVAKRLADQVRLFLKEHAPDEAVPGDNKNDRLFDTWQEYGCILPNPATRQAIWYVVVHGTDGETYDHKLTMLRFPLEKLWDDPSHYPPDMEGYIEVLAGREKAVDAAARPESTPAAEPVVAADSSCPEPSVAAAAAPSSLAVAAAKEPPGKTPEIRAPAFRKPNRAATASPPTAAATVSRPEAAATPPPAASAGLARPSASAAGATADDELLDDEDSARRAAKTERVKAELNRLAASGVARPPSKPVALIPDLPDLSPRGDQKSASPRAVAFLEWLLAGLQSRAIKYNEVGAPVHFVASGMALVSPYIFRQYATETGDASGAADRLGLDIQREVLKAGWHVPAPGGTNIHHFAVVKRGGVRAGKLSAVVLKDPSNWVIPVPPSNPAIVPMHLDATPASTTG